MSLLKSELLKVWTTRAWWILAVVMVLYVGFVAVILAFTFGQPGLGEDSGAFGAGAPVNIILSTTSGVAYVFPLLIGSLIVTAEYRNKTIVPTYLVSPTRNAVLVAKIGAGLLVGLFFGIVGTATSLGGGGGLLELLKPGSFAAVDYWMALRVVVAIALWAVIGVGVGALVQSQIAAIVIVLVFTQFIEPIIRLVAGFWDWSKDIAEFLPGSASDIFVGSSIMNISVSSSTANPVVDWWGGGLLLIAYAVVFVALAMVTRQRADVA